MGDADNDEKSGYTNALRRAAQDAWGIGRYLYNKGIPGFIDPNNLPLERPDTPVIKSSADATRAAVQQEALDRCLNLTPAEIDEAAAIIKAGAKEKSSAPGLPASVVAPAVEKTDKQTPMANLANVSNKTETDA